jgi:predicted dehydrogenase
MLVEFSQASLLQKASSQPDKVKQVLDKVKTDGMVPTLEAVFRKLDEPMPLGYCNVGVVLDSASSKAKCGIQTGDRVISNGQHAEIVSVPSNLCAKIPEGVTDEDAAFAVLGAIALQGIRLAQPTLGERFMVVGLGLIGQLAVQLLRAHGCHVLGVDPNAGRLKLAERFGAATVPAGNDTVAAAEAWSNGGGIDGVLITASAKTDDIMHQAALSCRKRGRIVLVGVVGLNLRRDDFYKKELSFQVSCSYGPGRYDEQYEQEGCDYPMAYVRWTEQRNFEAVLAAIKAGQIDVGPLITHHFKFENALAAYETIQKDATALGVILQYADSMDLGSRLRITEQVKPPEMASPKVPGSQATANSIVGIIGAGNYAKAILLPALSKTNARLACLADRNPLTAAHTARKFHVEDATTDYHTILADHRINTVFILTKHNSHSRLVCEALTAGKHVFVEKPLCLNETELREIAAAYDQARLSSAQGTPLLMVGFNRRFSAHTIKIKELLAGRTEPLCINMTVNGGCIPSDHWTQDPKRGGGRVIGEACHFIDLLAFLAGAPVTLVSAMNVGEGPTIRTDKMSIQLGLSDGSICTLNYFANGSRSYPKETLEVFSDGRVIRMENFRTSFGYGFNRFSKFKTWRQDKGHEREIAIFIERASRSGDPLIPFFELANITQASFAAMESAATVQTVRLT